MNNPISLQGDLLLGPAEATSRAVLDALTDQVCVVDTAGRIVAVNESWKRFALEAGLGDATLCTSGVGQNYLDVTRAAAEEGVTSAQQALDGLTSVLRGVNEQFTMEYESADGPGQHRWFLMTVASLAQLPGALISHREITGRRRAEEALRLSGEMQSVRPVFDSFVHLLVKNVAASLRAENAFLTQVEDTKGTRVRLITHWTGDGYGPVFSYETAGTPCEVVVSGRTAVFPSGVQKLFPGDTWLKAIGAESYVAVPMFDTAGSVIGHLGVIDSRAIEDAAFAETALRVFASKATPELERLRMEAILRDQARIIENAPDAIIGTDEHFVITFWNKAAERIYGWRADEVVGRRAGEVFETNFTEEQRADVARTLLETHEYRAQVTHHRRDGSEIEIGIKTLASLGADGTVNGFISINRDISRLKRARDALRLQERMTQDVLNAIPDMIFTLDGNGRFLDFKPAQGTAPLIPPSAFLGRLVEEVMPSELAGRITAVINEVLASGESRMLEYELTEADGTHTYEARVIPSGPDQVLAIVRDFTGARPPATDATRSVQPAPSLLATRVLRRRQHARPTVLIVDQDVQALRFLRRLMDHSSYEALVASDPEEALHLAEFEAPDIVLLDLALPGGGFQVFHEICASYGAGLIVITSEDREDDAVAALRSGADDYIKKPISPAELTARIEVVLKRRSLPELVAPKRFEIGDLVIDSATYGVAVNGQPVTLTPTEYRLLYELATSAARLLIHSHLLERVWGNGYSHDHELLRSFVRTLRQKLGDDPKDPRFIRSVRGMGYQLVSPRKMQ